MSRVLRIEYEGALYHLLSRGIKRSDIFVGDYDRKRFLDAIEEMSERFEIDVFAYVLMSNHLRLGFILGTKDFVENIRKQYLPSKLVSAVPQQNQLTTIDDFDSFLIKAGRSLKCDLNSFVQAGRFSGTDKDKRDLLLYFI